MTVPGPHWTCLALAVAVGSAVGGTLRWGVAQGLQGRAPGGVHLATFAVNLLGSFVFCWLMQRQLHVQVAAPIYLGLTTGLLGGFTTYSTFNAELLQHLSGGAPGKAAAYFAVTTLGCLGGGAIGWWVGNLR